MRLRDLLKFDFFFSDKEQFRDEMREEMSLYANDWESRVNDPDEARELLESIRPFQSHRTLRAFFEAYSLVADRLVVSSSDDSNDESDLVRECLTSGKQYLRQRRLRSAEAVSKTLLQNGVKLAGNLDLLNSDSNSVDERRQRFANELHDTIRRLDAIHALASIRRASALRLPVQREI